MDQPQRQLPEELEEDILQYLIHDVTSLGTWSLVCHRFAYAARKYLFHTIVLEFSSYGSPQTLPARFLELIISSPYIYDLVQSLLIIDNRYAIGGATHLRFDTILPTCLPLLRKLKSISVESLTLTSLSWTAMSQYVQLALRETFRLPSVVSISFYRILDLPLSPLSGCASLQSLSLKLVTFSAEDVMRKEEDQQVGVKTTQESIERPRLTSMLLMLSDPLFHFFAKWVTSTSSTLDISNLRRLSVSMTMEYYDHGNVRMLLEATASSLEIFCFSPIFGGSSNTVTINPIDVGSLRSLRILRLRLGMIQTIFSRVPTDLLPWVVKFISQLNSEHMQEISLKISLRAQLQHGQDNVDMSSWSALDSVLTETCPSLFKFTLFVLQEETDLRHDEILSSIRKHLSSLSKRGVLNIETAYSRMGFFGSEPSSNIIHQRDISYYINTEAT